MWRKVKRRIRIEGECLKRKNCSQRIPPFQKVLAFFSFLKNINFLNLSKLSIELLPTSLLHQPVSWDLSGPNLKVRSYCMGSWGLVPLVCYVLWHICPNTLTRNGVTDKSFD